MHIGLLSPAWPSTAYPNGIVTYVDCLRQELIKQGHRVSVFAFALDDRCVDASVHLVKPGARERIGRAMATRVLGRTATVFDYGRTAARAIQKVHARDPIDVVEMEESFGFSAKVAQDTGLPVVVKLHGPAFLTMVDEELKTPFGAEKVRREGEALQHQQVLIAPSHCTLTDTLARYALCPAIAEQVVNPVAADSGLPLWQLERCDRDTLLFVGRFDKVKGADVLLRAYAQLLTDRPRLKLVFVGPDGGLPQASGGLVHLREFVASLANPALERGLSFRGRLDRSEIPALRASALVTVIASRRENQPYSALEAMLQACPVVCADTSGLSEIVAHGVTGLKAKAEDPVDLAAQIKRIVDDPALGQALGRAARAYVLEHHAPATVARQTLDVYRRAIELHRQRQP
jgi:glycosyltransferase involved in cell wall biosynthesis